MKKPEHFAHTKISTAEQMPAWFAAMRPKTLPAALAPVLMGLAFAWEAGCFSLVPALTIVCCALLIQIGTNFANDVADFQRGTDTEQRLGPQRAVQAGLISERQMWIATSVVLGLALVLGGYLVSIAGLPILLIGASALVFAVLYSVGPWALSYTGAADIFVFFYFGPIATLGTQYILCKEITASCFWAGCASGALSTAILAVNNLRDRATDSVNDKKTLAVRLGERAARRQCALLLLAPALIVSLLAYHDPQQRSLVFALFYLAPASVQIRLIYSGVQGQALNEVLAGVAKTLLVFSVLFSLGVLS